MAKRILLGKRGSQFGLFVSKAGYDVSDTSLHEDKLIVGRARKIQRFLTQPFFVAEQFTGTPGQYVSVAETVRGFLEILDGKHDDLPEGAFYMIGSIDQALERAKDLEN